MKHVQGLLPFFQLKSQMTKYRFWSLTNSSNVNQSLLIWIWLDVSSNWSRWFDAFCIRVSIESAWVRVVFCHFYNGKLQLWPWHFNRMLLLMCCNFSWICRIVDMWDTWVSMLFNFLKTRFWNILHRWLKVWKEYRLDLLKIHTDGILYSVRSEKKVMEILIHLNRHWHSYRAYNPWL